jgi:predicted Zn-dependent protease
LNPILPVDPRRRWPARLTALACAAALACPAALPPASAQNRLPTLGDPSSEDFSIATERQLGDAIMREIRADPDYIDDPVLLEYLQALFQPLVAQARLRGNIGPDVDARLAWEPFLVRDRSVNAFALPGGFIGVHLGLIAMTASRDELASVLAHELSHITQRHIARSIANSKRQSLLSLAAMVVGLLAASRAGSSGIDAANAAVVGSQALAAQGQLNFSRDMEREADRVGFALLSGAGYAPGGMAAMFEKLDQSSRLNDSGGFPYLRSHPLTSERIGEARARLGTSEPSRLGTSSDPARIVTADPLPPAATAPVATTMSRLEHTAAQARSRVMMDARFDALRRWQALDGDRVSTSVADKLLSAYESALASTLLRDWARADASIATAFSLVRAAPSDARPDAHPDARAERAVTLLQVQSLLARGAVAKAVRALEPIAGDGSRPVLLLATQATLAAAAVSSPPPAAAADSLMQRAAELQTWVAVNPRDSLAWTALSQVEERLAQPLRAIRADAEARYALGDLSGAADRLRAGQRRARSGGAVDFIDVSVIDARLRDIELQRKKNEVDEKALK